MPKNPQIGKESSRGVYQQILRGFGMRLQVGILAAVFPTAAANSNENWN
jgi:hypothetical protein